MDTQPQPLKQVTFLKKDIPELAAALAQARDFANTPAIAYKIIQFRKKVLGIEADLKELTKAPKEIDEFESKRLDLCKKMAKRDANKMPVVVNGNFQMVDADAFEAALAEIRKDYKEHLDAWDAKVKAVNAELLLPVSNEELPQASIPRFKLDWFKAAIPGNVIEALFPIMEAEEPKGT